MLVTHDIDEALTLADPHCADGQRAGDSTKGTPLELLTRPATDFVRDFFGRSELGVRLLSLPPRRRSRAFLGCSAGKTDKRNVKFAQALSLFVDRRCGSYRWLIEQGEPCGVLHFSDLVRGENAPVS